MKGSRIDLDRSLSSILEDAGYIVILLIVLLKEARVLAGNWFCGEDIRCSQRFAVRWKQQIGGCWRHNEGMLLRACLQ